MTSERPYRAARTTSDALTELRRCSRTQFDPGIVEAFCARLEDPDLARPHPAKPATVNLAPA